jgi:hypothetical protein
VGGNVGQCDVAEGDDLARYDRLYLRNRRNQRRRKEVNETRKRHNDKCEKTVKHPNLELNEVQQ